MKNHIPVVIASDFLAFRIKKPHKIHYIFIVWLQISLSLSKYCTVLVETLFSYYICMHDQGWQNRSSRFRKCRTKDSIFILKIIINPKPTINSNLVATSVWCLKGCNDYSFYLYSSSISATKVFQFSQTQAWRKSRRAGILSRLVREIWLASLWYQ